MWPQVFLRIREEARGAEIITKYITAQSTNVAVQSYNPFRHRYPVGINRNCGKDKTHQQNKKRNTKKKQFFFAPFCATCLSERVTTYWRAISKGPTSAKVNGSSQQRISEKSLLASASHQLTRLIVTRPLLTWGGGTVQ